LTFIEEYVIMSLITREYAKELVGKGWSQLIDELFNILPEDSEVMDVKEKWGSLRIYVYNVPDKTYELIKTIEDRSSKICESCGKDSTIQLIQGWMRSLCQECCDK
jgi:hypothetical protein